jgi:hypothetical protein
MAANGIATIAINLVGHGLGPLSTLTVTRTDGTQATFPSGGRGEDQNGDNIIDPNEGFYATAPFTIKLFGDSFVQTAVDIMQLIRTIELGMDVDGDGKPDLDPSQIYYLGQSAGANLGTDLLTVEPDIRAGAIVVAGGPRLDTMRLAPVSRSMVGRLFQNRKPSLINPGGLTSIGGIKVLPPYFDENKPLRNVAPVINNVAGAIDIQTVIDRQTWLGQTGDPIGYAPHLRKAPLVGMKPKPVLLLVHKTDRSQPAPSSTALIRAGDLADVTTYYRHDLAFADDPLVPRDPHTVFFMIDNPHMASFARALQQHAAEFFASGGTQISQPEPARLFEVPISLPLQEGLDYLPP